MLFKHRKPLFKIPYQTPHIFFKMSWPNYQFIINNNVDNIIVSLKKHITCVEQKKVTQMYTRHTPKKQKKNS